MTTRTPLDRFRHSTARADKLRGVHLAIVTANEDPEGRYRVKVKFPWLSDSDRDDTYWARILVHMGGVERGTYFLPEIDDQVLVVFEHGEVEKPIVVGGLWSKKQPPPELNKDSKNNMRVIKSRSGHRLIFDDTDGEERVILVDSTGSNKILLDSAKDTLTIQTADGDINMTAKGAARFQATDVSIAASSNFNGKCTDFVVDAGASLAVNAGAMLAIKAQSTSLNPGSATQVKTGEPTKGQKKERGRFALTQVRTVCPPGTVPADGQPADGSSSEPGLGRAGDPGVDRSQGGLARGIVIGNDGFADDSRAPSAYQRERASEKHLKKNEPTKERRTARVNITTVRPGECVVVETDVPPAQDPPTPIVVPPEETPSSTPVDPVEEPPASTPVDAVEEEPPRYEVIDGDTGTVIDEGEAEICDGKAKAEWDPANADCKGTDRVKIAIITGTVVAVTAAIIILGQDDADSPSPSTDIIDPTEPPPEGGVTDPVVLPPDSDPIDDPVTDVGGGLEPSPGDLPADPVDPGIDDGPGSLPPSSDTAPPVADPGLDDSGPSGPTPTAPEHPVAVGDSPGSPSQPPAPPTGDPVDMPPGSSPAGDSGSDGVGPGDGLSPDSGGGDEFGREGHGDHAGAAQGSPSGAAVDGESGAPAFSQVDQAPDVEGLADGGVPGVPGGAGGTSGVAAAAGVGGAGAVGAGAGVSGIDSPEAMGDDLVGQAKDESGYSDVEGRVSEAEQKADEAERAPEDARSSAAGRVPGDSAMDQMDAPAGVDEQRVTLGADADMPDTPNADMPDAPNADMPDAPSAGEQSTPSASDQAGARVRGEADSRVDQAKEQASDRAYGDERREAKDIHEKLSDVADDVDDD